MKNTDNPFVDNVQRNAMVDMKGECYFSDTLFKGDCCVYFRCYGAQ